MRIPLAALAILASIVLPAHAADDIVARGAYLFNAGGCLGCHTAPGGATLAGGRALVTPMGTFYGPNITPDPEHGIGGWTDEDFVRALHHGVARDIAEDGALVVQTEGRLERLIAGDVQWDRLAQRG